MIIMNLMMMMIMMIMMMVTMMMIMMTMVMNLMIMMMTGEVRRYKMSTLWKIVATFYGHQ